MSESGRYLVMRFPGGALGNQMFNYALARQYADEFGYELVVEGDWLGSRIFEGVERWYVFDPEEFTRFQEDRTFAGVVFRENPIWERDAHGGTRFVRCDDTFVTHRYSGLFRPEIVATHPLRWLRSVFAFREDIRQTDTYRRLEDEQGTYDAAHVRRGELLRADYRGAQSVVSEASYRRAFERNEVETARLRICSNAPRDPATGGAMPGNLMDQAWRINCPPPAFAAELAFLEGLPCSPWRELHPVKGPFPQPYRRLDLEGFAALLYDYLTMFFARRLFRSNSTLSWWIGCLSPVCRVFAPRIEEEHIDRRTSLPPKFRNRGNGRVIDVEFIEGNHPTYYTLPQLIGKEFRPGP